MSHTVRRDWLHLAPVAVAEANARLRRWRKLVLLLVLFAMLIALNSVDYWLPLFQHDSGCHSRQASVSLPDEFFFRYLVFRRAGISSSRVSIVTMGDSEATDLLTDVCSGRRFTADVIDALNRRAVSVIALDKEYGAGSCRQAAANAALVAAVERSHAKIVMGQGTHDVSGQDASQCLVLSKGLAFGTADVRHGLTDLNENSLKIPLRWPVYPNDEEAQQGIQAKAADEDTFALATAAVVDSRITARPILAANLARHSHPFGDFRAAIDQMTATDLLCSDAAGAAKLAEWGDHCAESKPLDLRGRVVVVANRSSTDVHPFLGDDNAPGSLLQAHYIEALLSGHYYSEVPFWLAVIVFVFWLIVTEALLIFLTPENKKRLMVRRIIVAAIFIALGLTVTLQFFDIVPPVSFFVAAAVILCFDWLSESLSTHKSEVFDGGNRRTGGG